MPAFQNTGMVEHSGMNDSVSAIVLKQMDYREKDVLFTVMTKEYGKLSFIASGARKLTSKNARAITPYSLCTILFDYQEHKSLFRLKTGTTVKMYSSLYSDLVKSSAASIVCSVMDSMSLIHNEDGLARQQYTLVEEALEKIDAIQDTSTVLCLYLADVLRMFGSIPYVDGCVLCQNDGVSSISVKDGGFVCAQHARIEELPVLKKDDLKRFRLFCKATLQRYSLIQGKVRGTLQDVRYFADFLHAYAGISQEGFAFYEQVCHLNKIS